MIVKFLATKILGSWPLTSLGLIFSRHQPLVVLYHGVTSDTSPQGIRNYRKKHVDVKTFEREVEWLSKHFTIVPLREIESLAKIRKRTWKPLCAITFDDGYKNNYVHAFPILKKHNLPATIFITTGFVDKKIALWPDVLEECIENLKEENMTIPWSEGEITYSIKNHKKKIGADIAIRSRLKKVLVEERGRILGHLMKKAAVSIESTLQQPDYASLSWEEVQEMKNNGITFGAHTENHPILSRLPKEEQESEILLSIKALRSKIGHCEHFAYPNGQYGDWDEATKSILKDVGIFCAWTTLGKRVSLKKDDLLELPRVTLDNTEDLARFRAFAGNIIPFIKKLKNG